MAIEKTGRRRGPKRLNRAERYARNEKIAKRYEAGEAVEDIASENDLSPAMVRIIVRQWGLGDFRAQRGNNERMNRVRRVAARRKEGVPLQTLAKEEEVSVSTISGDVRIAKEEGLL